MPLSLQDAAEIVQLCNKDNEESSLQTSQRTESPGTGHESQTVVSLKIRSRLNKVTFCITQLLVMIMLLEFMARLMIRQDTCNINGLLQIAPLSENGYVLISLKIKFSRKRDGVLSGKKMLAFIKV